MTNATQNQPGIELTCNIEIGNADAPLAAVTERLTRCEAGTQGWTARDGHRRRGGDRGAQSVRHVDRNARLADSRRHLAHPVARQPARRLP